MRTTTSGCARTASGPVRCRLSAGSASTAPSTRLGAVRQHEKAWTRYGWVHEPVKETDHGYNIRRMTLDPVAACDGRRDARAWS